MFLLSSCRGLVIFCCLLSAGLGASAQEADRAPVLLRKSLLLTPIETAGTGLAPEVKVRVEVDERGRVAEVETLAITPASDYDDLFREVTRAEISEWRYAPAIEGGLAVGKTLEWTVKFQALARQQAGAGGGLRHWTTRPTSINAEARRAQILALPLEQRKVLLRQHSATAEKFMPIANRRRFDTPRFVVIAESPDEKTAEVIAGNLEAIFNIIQDLFGDRIQPQPERLKIVVYVYARRASFEALTREIGFYEWSVGFYDPAGLFAFHLEMPTPEDLLGTMMHEATHAFIDRHMMEPGTHLPRWLGEGFAEYVGNSEFKKGKLIPGKTPKEKFVLVPGFGAVRAKPQPRMSLQEVKRAIRQGEGLSIEQLTGADGNVFYGEKRALYYPSAWLLVHYLRHGEPRWADQRFPAFMLYTAEGYPAIEALKTVYGFSPEELDERFKRYVKEF